MLGFLLVVLLIPYLIAAYALLLVKLRWGLRLFGAFIVATIALLTAMFIVEAYPIIARDGIAVFLEARWDPVRESYGVLQALVGTVLTSAVAMALAMPMAIGVAVTINEILPARLRGIFGSLVDHAPFFSGRTRGALGPGGPRAHRAGAPAGGGIRPPPRLRIMIACSWAGPAPRPGGGAFP